MSVPSPHRFLEKLLIIAVGVLAYCNSFNNPFLYDDSLFILDTRTQSYFWPLWRAFISPAHFQPVIHRPLVTLSLAVNFALDGLNVWGYHAFNLAIHLLAALTLFAVLRRTLEGRRLAPHYGAVARPLALTISLLWVVHPINTGAVTFIYQRAEAMMGLFILLTLYGIIRCAESPASRRWKFFALIVCATGMMGKQGMITAPPLALAYDRVFLSDSWKQTFRLRGKLYLFLVSTLLIPVFFFAAGHHENPSNFGWLLEGVSPFLYAINQPDVILHYLKLSFWPRPLMLDYDWLLKSHLTKELLPPLLAVTALFSATLWALRRRPELGFLGFAFFLLLSPTCSFIAVADPGAEHRFYLALAVVLTLTVIGGYELLNTLALRGNRRWKHAAPVLAACAVGALTLGTILRNYDYRSAISIWSDNMAKNPGSLRVRSQLGSAYQNAGKYPEALEQLRIGLQAERVAPETFADLATVLSHLDQLEKAIACIKAAQEIAPRDPRWRFVLGMIYLRNADPVSAGSEFSRVLQMDPRFPDTENVLGVTFFQRHQLEEALLHFQWSVWLEPNNGLAYHNLGITLARLGRLKEASEAFQKAYRLDESLEETDRKLVHDSRFQPGVAALQ